MEIDEQLMVDLMRCGDFEWNKDLFGVFMDTTEIETLRKLKVTVTTFLYEIDSHDDYLGPVLMSSGMWLSVSAMRKLLLDTMIFKEVR